MKETRFTSFAEFWPFYLSEHSSVINRRLHFIGSGFAIMSMAGALFLRNISLFFLGIVGGYFFAWIGHFIIEKNRPATFSYPLWSLRGDFKMFFLILSGRLHEELLKKAKHPTDSLN